MKSKIILVGNGWGGSSFLKHIDSSKYDITVISPDSNFIYTPSLVESIFKNYDVKYDSKNLNNFTHVRDRMKNLDYKNNKINLESNIDLHYDYLVLCYGSTINTFNIPGIENAISINYDNINKIRDKLKNLEKGKNITIIGCGPTGTELIGNILDLKKFNINVVDGLPKPLTMYNDYISRYVLDIWKKNNINFYFNNIVKKVDKNNIYFNNKKLNYDMLFWCGGYKISSLGITINNKIGSYCKNGLSIDNKLRLNFKNNENIYAIGDCIDSKYPKTAQVAYQQGKYLANSFNNNFKSTKEFKYNDKGKICYIGDNKSVYENKYFYLSGTMVRYLDRFIKIYNTINFNHMKNFIFKNNTPKDK